MMQHRPFVDDVRPRCRRLRLSARGGPWPAHARRCRAGALWGAAPDLRGDVVSGRSGPLLSKARGARVRCVRRWPRRAVRRNRQGTPGIHSTPSSPRRSPPVSPRPPSAPTIRSRASPGRDGARTVAAFFCGSYAPRAVGRLISAITPNRHPRLRQAVIISPRTGSSCRTDGGRTPPQ